MRAKILIVVILLFSLNALSQNSDIFKMKKEQTGSLPVDKTYTSDTRIDLSDKNNLSSLSVSGNIKLIDSKSLIRIILVTKAHEYLVYEAYPLIAEKLDFSIDKVCEETSLMNNEEPIELIVIVRNAELKLDQIHISNVELNDNERYSFAELKQESKKQAEKYKSTKINYYNSKEEKTWLADTTRLSTLPFESKKTFFGGGYDFITDGYEYYSDGIFSFESFLPGNMNLKSAATVTYPTSFDWRNRHGQNWMTPIKLQGDCGACTAFTSIAALEIMTNLYFNSHINVDLSEQELVSCYGIPCPWGAITYDVFNYLKAHPVSNEGCFPYSATNEPCSNKCTSPTEKMGFTSIYSVGSSESAIKNALIFKGPLVSDICMGNWCHAMALVGYNVIQMGDLIRRYSSGTWIDVTIQAGDPLIGQTYWIFKNSYPWGNAGYHYIFFNNVATDLSVSGAINPPITSLNYSESNRVCIDNDGDGYYNWGIGSKPSTCPLCSTSQEDGDDSNPNLGPMDAYGNCTPISSPYPYAQHLITSTETWQSTTSECGNVIVTNTGNLTISGATINLEGNATFSVEVGGTLTFNSGTIQ